MTPEQRDILRMREEGLTRAEIAERLGTTPSAIKKRLERARAARERGEAAAYDRLQDLSYTIGQERTPQEAWDSHARAFELSATKALKSRHRVIQRPAGAYCVYHSTDEHIDDDSAPLRLIEADIRAAHDMGAIMCHGGDLLNNWPMAGKLAAKWAEQDCSLPDALLRMQHFIALFKPDAWTDGNHEEMNIYLAQLIDANLPPNVIKDYWTVRFSVQTEGGRECRIAMSHKFQKGSTWFHPHHGVVREMLEGEEADLLMEGHLHISGWMYRSLPERGLNSLAVSSAGYKILDKYAKRISRSNGVPKLKGRCHWIIVDDQADHDQAMCHPFDCPRQAEGYLNGLQNLRAL